MKRTFLIMILAISLCGCGKKTDALKVPKSEDITSIEVKIDGEASTYDDEAFIDEFANILLDTEPTRKESVNDSPYAEDTISVSVLCDNSDDVGFFVYTSRNKTYIEIPYEGIWEVAPALYYGLTNGSFKYEIEL
ncbi:hypothetical protein IMSAG049_00504 [Clostridiales bacterium]|nr:hypothetical protein IMSAG049_00504 [Clostridiales bacterium]